MNTYSFFFFSIKGSTRTRTPYSFTAAAEFTGTAGACYRDFIGKVSGVISTNRSGNYFIGAQRTERCSITATEGRPTSNGERSQGHGMFWIVYRWSGKSVACSVDWLIDWLTNCLIDLLIYWLIDQFRDWLIDWLIDIRFVVLGDAVSTSRVRPAVPVSTQCPGQQIILRANASSKTTRGRYHCRRGEAEKGSDDKTEGIGGIFPYFSK